MENREDVMDKLLIVSFEVLVLEVLVVVVVLVVAVEEVVVALML
jgi:hypothetical protein